MKESTKAKKIKELFIRKKPSMILLNIFEKSPTFASQISKDTNTTFLHSERIIAEFEKYGIITISKKTGRTKYITITEQGKDLAGSLMAIIGFKK